MMQYRAWTVGIGAAFVALAGCKGASAGAYEGTWQYDRESLRALAYDSAYDSMTADGEDPLTAEQQAELERWVNEQHDQWDKRLEVLPDGRFVAISQTGESEPERIEGTWLLGEHGIEFVEHGGELMAIGHRRGANLVLVMTDDEGTTGQMVMLPMGATE